MEKARLWNTFFRKGIYSRDDFFDALDAHVTHDGVAVISILRIKPGVKWKVPCCA